MSVKLMRLVWDIPGYTMAEKMVLLKLADYAQDDGTKVFPSKDTVAQQCGCDVRTVRKAIDKLMETGALCLVNERLGRPTVYCLDVERLHALKVQTSSKNDTPSKVVTPDKNAPPTKLHQTPDKNVLNPPQNCTPIEQTTINNHHEDKENAREVVVDEVLDPLAETAVVVPSWAADWPILHVEGGDFEIKEPYASHPEIREGMIEWINRRHANKDLKRKGKCMPTVFGMQRSTCGWWDKYPLEAVAHAVTRAASEGWQGIIEDIARTWKPEPGSAASVKSSVQHRVQNMRDTMEKRQQMIREAASRAAVLTSPQNQLPAREVEQDGRA